MSPVSNKRHFKLRRRHASKNPPLGKDDGLKEEIARPQPDAPYEGQKRVLRLIDKEGRTYSSRTYSYGVEWPDVKRAELETIRDRWGANADFEFVGMIVDEPA